MILDLSQQRTAQMLKDNQIETQKLLEESQKKTEKQLIKRIDNKLEEAVAIIKSSSSQKQSTRSQSESENKTKPPAPIPAAPPSVPPLLETLPNSPDQSRPFDWTPAPNDQSELPPPDQSELSPGPPDSFSYSSSASESAGEG
jgi:hypothetical protein